MLTQLLRTRPNGPWNIWCSAASTGEEPYSIVMTALEALAPGGTLALAGIHVTEIPPLDYQRHVFHEKVLTSVESNTRRDGEEFLTLAARLGIRPETTVYPFEHADRALEYLSVGDVRGAGVLRVAERR